MQADRLGDGVQLAAALDELEVDVPERGQSRSNFEEVRRRPLATARNRPRSRPSSDTIESASPSLYVRSTTASSRKSFLVPTPTPQA
ncbi:hypothetical protein GCM10029992_63240 [Glycomyces albus]